MVSRLTVLSSLLALGGLLILPALAFLTVSGLFEKKRAALALAGLLLGAELIGGAVLYVRPLYFCPEEYAVSIGDELENRLREGELPARRGFWSSDQPCLAVCSRVTYAAENTVHVRTWYFPFGSCETGVNPDGLYPVK